MLGKGDGMKKIKIFLHRNAKKIALGVMIFCLIITVLSLRKTQTVLQSTDLGSAKNGLVSVDNGVAIEQWVTISEKESPVHSIGIWVATYQNRLTVGDVTIKVLDEDGQLLTTKVISADKIMDNDQMIVELTPLLEIGAVNEKRLKLQIVAKGLKETDQLAIWAERNIEGGNGLSQVSVGGEEKENTVLRITIYSLHKERNIGMFYFFSIGVIIIIAVYSMLPGRAKKERGESIVKN